jgi:peptide/nickel transport system permease protein
MGSYLLKRGAGVVTVILTLIIFTFIATNLLGDPIALMTDPETSTQEDIDALRHAAGLDRPWPERFVEHIGNTLQGDFGQSLWLQRPATTVVLERIPATLALAGITVAFSLLVSVGLALVSIWKQGTALARGIFIVSTALACIPSFWLAIVLILLLAVRVSVFPTSGYGMGTNLVLPVLSLSAQPIGHFTQILTAGMQEHMGQAHVRTARSKGLGEGRVLLDHVLRNTSILATTMVGSMIASLLNGAVLAESIFAWPGIGHLGLQAVQNRDLPVLTAVIFYAGVTVSGVNLLVDVLYTRLDPRIRLR